MVAPGYSSAWHGTSTVALDSAASWQVGPFLLWARRSADEWRLGLKCNGDPLDTTLEVKNPSALEEAPEGCSVRRYAFRKAPATISLEPALADRPVVVSPEGSLMLPPREEVTLYISTPLWITIHVGEEPELLVEEPMFRPSDTWFGPSTMDGELCYAVRTGAVAHLADLPSCPHRAISQVRIHNTAASVLSVEAIKIPTPQMSLFAGSDGRLWTRDLTLERHEEGVMAAVKLEKGAPRQAAGAVRISPPRIQPARGLAIRAFSELLRLGG